ncbi:cyclin-like protein [Lophiostoma macrostomum CBS 122681]|uniref:RNA polymerase II holoenzyme cyclin-like subunit n=1 Tax=Lophiostoma macrostomum CBS 122681 TaxID=1314788 RepID=A0A6A6TAG6_9PLEO|nr:cyclin-like protein [Lophiostoma macrostomum CBS 122681]
MVSTAIPRPTGREPPRPPPPAVEQAEKQWIFSDDELLQTPSIMDGMPVEEEQTLRRKGTNFILQVGMMLKLPQTTLSTAAVFFNRYLMRNSLKARAGYKPLHHYQIAATALFLATKVEENCRKMRELVVACVRVALKDPNKLVDEQTKDFWKWRDTILYSEDVVLESLCFDLSVEPPYQTMYNMLKYYGLEHNKKLRNASWAFLSDSCLTQLCLLYKSRTIAAASLYAAARLADIELPEEDGKPWWEIQHIKLRDIRRACNLMVNMYEESPNKDGEASIYVGLRTPDEWFERRQSLTRQQTPDQPSEPMQVDQPVANGVDDGSEEGELDG